MTATDCTQQCSLALEEAIIELLSDMLGEPCQGLISADLTWLAAVKFAVLVGVLSGIYPTLTEAFNRR